MKTADVAVLGTGNGGMNFAAELALAGFDVNLFDLPRFFEDSAKPIADEGGIELKGVGRTGFAELNMVTNNIEDAISGVQAIIIAVPTFAHREFAQVCAPFLEEGQVISLNPGYSFGAIEFANTLIDEGFDLDKVTVCETASLLYATRKYLPNRVYCEGVKKKMPFAAFPGKKTEEALEVLQPFYLQEDGERGQLFPVENVLMVSLCNANPPGHIPMMLLKAVDVEQGEEPYLKCQESEAVAKLRKNLADEMLTLQKKLGFKPLSYEYVHETLFYPPEVPLLEISTDPECDEGPEWAVPENQPGLYASGTQKNLLKMRYLTEDVPYSLVGLSGLGDLLDIPTPVIDSSIVLANTITGEDFWHEGRTIEKVGLDNFTKDELLRYVNTGTI